MSEPYARNLGLSVGALLASSTTLVCCGLYGVSTVLFLLGVTFAFGLGR